jgi:hypothetical protein
MTGRFLIRMGLPHGFFYDFFLIVHFLYVTNIAKSAGEWNIPQSLKS